MLRSISILVLCIIAGILIWRSGDFHAQSVTLSEVFAEPIANQPGDLHVFLKLQIGDMPDRLIGASTPEAETAKIVSPYDRSGLVIPGGSNPSLSADGAYLVLSGVEGALDEGRLIPISLEFSGAGQVTTQALIGPATDPHAMHKAMAAAQSDGGMVMTEPGTDPPSLSMDVRQRDDETWEAALSTENFTFDEATDPPVHVPGHGHGHLYIDGLKLQRMYAENARIGVLPTGTYTVSVALNTNTHMPYMNDAGPVAAEATITVD